jgi:hypothetical protein
MDPYIEAHGLWEDFHAKLIGEIERALASALPDRYFVRIGERSYIILAGIDGKAAMALLPNVGVGSFASERPASRRTTRVAVTRRAIGTQAVTLRAFIDEHYCETFIGIFQSEPEERLVTCLDVLSPSNKRPGTEGWDVYLRKRNALLLGSASLVEIDLLRVGQRMPMVESWPKSPYYSLIARRERAPYCRVYPAALRQPLPNIPVPLDPPDPDIQLSIQPMIEAVYERSRYARNIEYTRTLTPPLSEEDAAWVKRLVPAGAQKPSARSGGSRRRR